MRDVRLPNADDMTPQQKLTQLQRVEKRLLERGSISRNECLSTFPAITRLGARIDDLERLGYEPINPEA